MSYSPPPGPPESSGPPAGSSYGPAQPYGAPSSGPQSSGAQPYGAPSYGTAPYGGAPAGGGTRFDAKSVDPLDWAAIGAGVLALIFSFFAFYSYSAKGETKSQGCSRLSEIPSAARGIIGDLCNGDNYSAWNGFFGWFGVLLGLVGALLVAVAVLAPRMNLPFPVRLAAAGAYVLGFIFVLLALFIVPRWPAADLFGISDSDYNKGIDEGHGFSYWIVLALTLIGAVLAFLRFTQTGGRLPTHGGTGGTGGTSGTGGTAAGQPGYPPPGGGYATPQTPAQPSQYGQPPQGPPAGYQQSPPQGPQGPPQGYQQPAPPAGFEPQQPPPGYNPPPQ